MIDKFEFQGFKSYQNATLPLAPLTLLIGANASGKSNAREAIQILAWMASGRRLDEIFQTVQDAEMAMRGRRSDLGYQGNDKFSLGCSLVGGHYGASIDFTIKLQSDEGGLRVIYEAIEFGDLLYRVKEAGRGLGHDLQVTYNNFKRGGWDRKPMITCTDQQAIFTQLTTPAAFRRGDEGSMKKIPAATEALREHLGQILFLDPVPSRMRGYSFLADRELRGNGSTLSSVLYHLAQEQKGAILAFIQSLPEQDIREVGFIEGPRGEVMVTLTESFGGKARAMDATLLSDGTLRVLAVAAALLSAPKNSLVVIEEIDNGVHPSRARMLLERIQTVAQERSLRVLLTTHNPAMLDALPRTAIPDVVCCYRDPDGGDSRLIRLADLAEYPRLIAQGPLGELVTRGVLDRMVKDRTTPEQRQDAAHEWLKSLGAGESES